MHVLLLRPVVRSCSFAIFVSLVIHGFIVDVPVTVT